MAADGIGDRPFAILCASVLCAAIVFVGIGVGIGWLVWG